MAHLTEEQKSFIVQRLACYRWPSEVVQDVGEEFGVVVDRSHVREYNPEQRSVAKKWRDLFDATRAAFLADASAEGIAHQPFRLRELGRIYRKAMTTGKGNLQLAAQVLEQAARETGGAFTNHRVLDGKLAVNIDDFLAEPEES